MRATVQTYYDILSRIARAKACMSKELTQRPLPKSATARRGKLYWPKAMPTHASSTYRLSAAGGTVVAPPPKSDRVKVTLGTVTDYPIRAHPERSGAAKLEVSSARPVRGRDSSVPKVVRGVYRAAERPAFVLIRVPRSIMSKEAVAW